MRRVVGGGGAAEWMLVLTRFPPLHRAEKEAIEFGFPPAKKAEMTVEAKARAVARRKATREARRTMGKRQREGVRGELLADGRDGDVTPALEERPWLPVIPE